MIKKIDPKDFNIQKILIASINKLIDASNEQEKINNDIDKSLDCFKENLNDLIENNNTQEKINKDVHAGLFNQHEIIEILQLSDEKQDKIFCNHRRLIKKLLTKS